VATLPIEPTTIVAPTPTDTAEPTSTITPTLKPTLILPTETSTPSVADKLSPVIEKSGGAFQLVQNDNRTVVETQLGDSLADVLTITHDGAKFDQTNIYNKKALPETKTITLDKLKVSWNDERNTLTMTDGETEYAYVSYRDADNKPAGIWASNELEAGVPYIWEAAYYLSNNELVAQGNDFMQEYIDKVLPLMIDKFEEMGQFESKFAKSLNDTIIESPYTIFDWTFAAPLLSVARMDSNGHTGYVLGFIALGGDWARLKTDKEYRKKQMKPIFVVYEEEGSRTWHQKIQEKDSKDNWWQGFLTVGSLAVLKDIFINHNGRRILISPFGSINPTENDAAFVSNPDLATKMGFSIAREIDDIWYKSHDYPLAQSFVNVAAQNTSESDTEKAWQDLTTKFLGCLRIYLQ
jgi:hypothetical protein